MSDPTLEILKQLTSSQASFWRAPEDGVLRVTGSDRVRFLNGMLTQDVAALETNRAVPCLQLDRKGHVLGVLWLIALDDAIWLDVASGRAAAVQEILEKHLIADDVAIELRSDVSVAVFEGDDTQSWRGEPVLEPGQVFDAGSTESPQICIADAGLAAGALRLIGPASWLDRCTAAFSDRELSDPELEALRIQSGQPLWDYELGERTFPAEAGLDRTAVSFEKGCYIGQEIVARIHSRGAVKRALVRLSSEQPLQRGAALERDGQGVGEVTTSSSVGPNQALAYLRVKAGQSVESGSCVDVAGARATVTLTEA